MDKKKGVKKKNYFTSANAKKSKHEINRSHLTKIGRRGGGSSSLRP